MARVSWLMIVPVVFFTAIAGLFLGGMFWGNPEDVPSALIGKPAPAVPVDALPGTVQLTDADLRSGAVTVVNYWASWCPPCRAEHPTLTAMAADGVRVAGINFRDQADTARAYLEDEGDPFFAMAFDPRGRTSIDWGVTAPPETFIVDGDGTILFRFAGPLIGSDYEQRFLPALNAALGR